jgi:putative ABC transport system ATP-binding protein
MALSLDHIVVDVPDGSDTLRILDGASLEVRPGEIVTLTGASGSGKSTLIAVAGLRRPATSGRVTVAGVDATDLGKPARTRLRRSSIGLVFQTPNLFPSLTAVEQLELVAHIAARRSRATSNRARELLVAVGLESRLHARPAQLSGGERQRVGLARAVMNEPQVLLADEPTAALDDQRARSMMALLASIATDRDVATLIVTHAADQLDVPHRRLHIEGGRMASVSEAGIPAR